MCIFNNPLVVQIDIIPVYISRNAPNAARAGILPQAIISVECRLIGVIMGNPNIILVENTVFHLIIQETCISIQDSILPQNASIICATVSFGNFIWLSVSISNDTGYSSL